MRAISLCMRMLTIFLISGATSFPFAAAAREHIPVERQLTGEQLAGKAPLLTETKRISVEGPLLTFKLFRVPAFSNSHYRIDVCTEEGGKTLQHLEIRNGIAVENRRKSLSILDIDGDGFVDIRLLAGFDKSVRGNRSWYKEWLYQPSSRTFEFRQGK